MVFHVPSICPPLYFSSSIQFVTVRIAADLESRIMTKTPRQQGSSTDEEEEEEATRQCERETHTRVVAHCCMERKTDGQE